MKIKLTLTVALCLVGLIYASVCVNMSGYYINGFIKSGTSSCLTNMKLNQSGCSISGTMGIMKFGGAAWPTLYSYTITGVVSGSTCNLVFSGSGSGSFSGTLTGNRLAGNLFITNPPISQTTTFAGLFYR